MLIIRVKHLRQHLHYKNMYSPSQKYIIMHIEQCSLETRDFTVYALRRRGNVDSANKKKINLLHNNFNIYLVIHDRFNYRKINFVRARAKCIQRPRCGEYVTPSGVYTDNAKHLSQQPSTQTTFFDPSVCAPLTFGGYNNNNHIVFVTLCILLNLWLCLWG